MFWWLKSDKNSSTKCIQSEKTEGSKLQNSLEANISLFKNIFKNDDTIIYRNFENPQNNAFRCCIIFIDGMVNHEIINENIIMPIITSKFQNIGSNYIEFLQYKLIISDDIQKTNNLDKLIESILIGDTILLLENSIDALIISSKGWQSRQIAEPKTEQILRGPREGFNESLITNLSLLRRRLKTKDLKFEFSVIGTRSNTKICLSYINGLANEKILQELKNRLNSICIDGVFDSGTIQELIRDSPFSPFKLIGNTERPDIIASKILEGRIALFVEGSPVVLALPHVFIELFQANEDYYINYFFSSINRMLRYVAFIISISTPAVYIALVTFHQEIIPTPLTLSIAAARQDVPFPTIIETIALLTVFEILRETGTRMPSFIGQSLSIVGGLVIGQAAVEARFVSAPIVIITALSGITGLMLPRLKGAIIFIRLIFLILASVVGLYGYVLGVAGLLLYLFSIRSFGVPFMTSLMTLQAQDLKDTAIRTPWWYMKQRPKFIGRKDYIRETAGEKTK